MHADETQDTSAYTTYLPSDCSNAKAKINRVTWISNSSKKSKSDIPTPLLGSQVIVRN